jgi:hypothetical protein
MRYGFYALLYELAESLTHLSGKKNLLGQGQNHVAVAGGCAAFCSERVYDVPTRYREVVLTLSKTGLTY